MPQVPVAAELNPILLWILIHGGDPAPDERVSRLSAALAIQQLATRLSASVAKEMHSLVAKEIAASAHAFGK